MAIISIISIHWNQFIALIGLGQEPARFDLVWKKQPLSLTYIATIMAIIALFEFLPYLEELVRGLRANHGKLVPPRDRTKGTRNQADMRKARRSSEQVSRGIASRYGSRTWNIAGCAAFTQTVLVKAATAADRSRIFNRASTRDMQQTCFSGTASKGVKIRWRNRAQLAFLMTLLFPPSVYADTPPRGPPLSYLQSFGERAAAINTLLWFLIAVSVAVIIMTIALLLGGIFRGGMRSADSLPGVVPLMPTRGGEIWIAVGVSITVLVLFASSVWTVVTLADVSFPPSRGKNLKLQITGHQWWWEVHYLSEDPSRYFRTANEIHIPTGEPVEVELVTSDVIHSFWVPTLNGKTDLIPGQRNVTWFTADKPGIYRGQCTEYCGRQHAHMALDVIAEAPDDFRAWWDHQLESLPSPVTADAESALGSFILKCGVCHSVRGTPAGGAIGPDLSHLMTRRMIAAGTVLNTIGGLSAWIADPQHAKPGNLMPAPEISGAELSRIRAFLGTLK